MHRFLFVVLSFICCNSIIAQSPLSIRTDYSIQDRSLEDALMQLSQLTAVNISYSNRLIPSDKRVSLVVKNNTIQAILDSLLQETNIQYKAIGQQIVLSKRPPPPTRKFTISGYLEDKETGEPLIGANVFDPNTTQGTSSNDYGFYSLTLKAGSLNLVFSYLGYEILQQPIELKKDTWLDIALRPSLTLEPVIVTASDSVFQIKESLQNNSENLSIEQIKLLPTLGGEADIWRNSYQKAGVQTGTDGVGGLLVRGGSVDQNLVLLDGVPIYNPTHAIGILSIFNTDAIKSAQLYKGNFPARYGGRLSSVMDIYTKEGNKKQFSGEVSAGLISGKATLEGPIIKDKISFFVSGRRSFTQEYIPALTKRVKENNNKNINDPDILLLAGNANYSFFDVNAKINADLSKKDKIFLSYYKGGDDFLNVDIIHQQDTIPTDFFGESLAAVLKDTSNLSFSWGNTASSFRWNHVFNNQLFANSMVNYSTYTFRSKDDYNSSGFYENEDTDHIYSTQKFRLDIQNWAAKIDFDYRPSPKHSLRFGIGASQQSFEPGVFFGNTQATNVPLLQDSIDLFDTLDIAPQIGYEYTAYFENNIRLSDRWQAHLGLHAASWAVDGISYKSVQPRLKTNYWLRPKWSLYLAYNQMVQPVHFLTKSNLGLPGDIWVPSTGQIAPEKAWQVAGGVTYKNPKWGEIELEAYYKKLDQIITFIQSDSLVILSAKDWEKNIAVGQGWAYGMEVSAQKTMGKFRTAFNYTLAWSERQFDLLNEGKRFPFRYDRRHSLKIMGQYIANDRMSFNATWLIESGARVTLPLLEYPVRTLLGEIIIQDPSSLNEIVTPNYHRLDIGFNYKIKTAHTQQYINIGLFNAYNQQNPVFYRLRQDKKLVQVTLLPLLPSLSYRIKFG